MLPALAISVFILTWTGPTQSRIYGQTNLNEVKELTTRANQRLKEIDNFLDTHTSAEEAVRTAEKFERLLHHADDGDIPVTTSLLHSIVSMGQWGQLDRQTAVHVAHQLLQLRSQLNDAMAQIDHKLIHEQLQISEEAFMASQGHHGHYGGGLGMSLPHLPIIGQIDALHPRHGHGMHLDAAEMGPFGRGHHALDTSDEAMALQRQHTTHRASRAHRHGRTPMV